MTRCLHKSICLLEEGHDFKVLRDKLFSKKVFYLVRISECFTNLLFTMSLRQITFKALSVVFPKFYKPCRSEATPFSWATSELCPRRVTGADFG